MCDNIVHAIREIRYYNASKDISTFSCSQTRAPRMLANTKYCEWHACLTLAKLQPCTSPALILFIVLENGMPDMAWHWHTTWLFYGLTLEQICSWGTIWILIWARFNHYTTMGVTGIVQFGASNPTMPWHLAEPRRQIFLKFLAAVFDHASEFNLRKYLSWDIEAASFSLADSCRMFR